jgi:hypothetical protein
VPTKSALLKWRQLNVEKSKGKSLLLFNFGSAGYPSSSLPAMLFRFTTEIKERLGLRNKVEVLPESLRRFFNFWLRTANAAVLDPIGAGSDGMINNIIMVVEGLDAMAGPAQEEIQLWIPKQFPSNIKMIITMAPESYHQL